MHVLVVTKETQGKRKNDFCWATEGELAGCIGFECDGEAVDGACGCRRSFIGFDSRKATTTAKVVDLPITGEVFRDKMKKTLVDSGWGKLATDEFIIEEVNSLLKIAGHFEVGAIIEKRGNAFHRRQ